MLVGMRSSSRGERLDDDLESKLLCSTFMVLRFGTPDAGTLRPQNAQIVHVVAVMHSSMFGFGTVDANTFHPQQTQIAQEVPAMHHHPGQKSIKMMPFPLPRTQVAKFLKVCSLMATTPLDVHVHQTTCRDTQTPPLTAKKVCTATILLDQMAVVSVMQAAV